MKGEFKKLLLSEFGSIKYQNMLMSAKKNDDSEIICSDVVIIMLDILLNKSNSEIENMTQRLYDTLLTAYKKSRGFTPLLISSVITFLFVLFLKPESPLNAVFPVIILFILFIKAVEIILNRYCYFDARIILSYKVSLDIVHCLRKQTS